MKKFLCILPLAALLCSCGDTGKNDPNAPALISLQEGCYASGDTAYVLVFPDGQHQFQYVTTVQWQDSMMVARRPTSVTLYNDTTGTGQYFGENDHIVYLSTNGKDSVWITSYGETMAFVRQPDVDNAPKKIGGTWKMSYDVNAYVSILLWYADISDDLVCHVEFNMPDSAGLMMMLEMAGAMNEMDVDMGAMFEGMPLNELLSAIPTGLEGYVWYTPAAGMGVFAPDVEGYDLDYAMLFTTPDGNTIRLNFGQYNLDMKRVR